jgi:hypothetical protein
MEKLKWLEKVTNEEIVERIGKNRMLLNNILRRGQLDWTYSMEEEEVENRKRWNRS